MKLLVLDMDGVIFAGANFWLDLHRSLGTEAEALRLWERYGTSRYRYLSEQTAGLWIGKSAASYFQLVRDRRYVPGCEDLVRHAKGKGVLTAIISSGAWHLAARAQRELGIDHIHANRLGIDLVGCFDGTVEVQVDNNHKDDCLRRLQAETGVSRSETVVIGDTVSDTMMSPLATLSIGYDLAGQLDGFDVTLSGSLAKAIPYMATAA
jgi:HAD superfamily phosphoserine phosphatase-like hydrolase